MTIALAFFGAMVLFSTGKALLRILVMVVEAREPYDKNYSGLLAVILFGSRY